MNGFPGSTDHLALAVPDVDAAAREMTGRLGVAPSAGGRHPGWGTRNVLYSLGERVYMELIGPDPDAAVSAGPLPLGLAELEGPRLAAWCARSSDLSAAVHAARRAGSDLGGVRALTRDNPDGTRLAWSMTPIEANVFGGVVPFLIDWGESPHPATTAASGCTLLELRGLHPEPAAVLPVLRVLGAELEIEQAETPGLVARLQTPRGVVELH